MTPLAKEILDDLAVEFTDGASVLMLRNWLGEPSYAIRRAIAELIDGKHIHVNHGRYFHGESEPLGGPHRAYTVRA